MAQMNDVKECRRCNGSGEIAISTRDGHFIAPGPVPDDATGFAVATCDECRGMGYVEDGSTFGGCMFKPDKHDS